MEVRLSNEFSSFADSLTEEQRAKLLEALTNVAPPPKPRVKRSVKKNKTIKETKANSRSATETRVTEDFKVIRENNVTRSKVKFRGNTWKDTGEEKDKSPITLDKEGKPFKPIERARPEPRIIEKVCHICQRKFKINEELVYGEFTRCDKCTG